MAPSSALLFPTAPRTSACQSLQRVSQQGKCRLSAHWWRVLSEVRSDNNTESIYASAWIDLKNGPVVIESPPNTLGIVDDFWFRYVADLGNAGPAKGKGGKYLFLPPGGYSGSIPEGYHVYKSRTFGNWFITRGFQENGDPKPGVESIKKHLRIYALAQASNPPATTFVNVSGKAFNTVHAMDFSYFEEINQVVQEEPNTASDPETLGLLASIGIEHGKPLAPGERMKKILTEAAAVGSATARALAYRSRDPEAHLYPNSAWQVPFLGGSYEFLRDGVRLLDARSFFTTTRRARCCRQISSSRASAVRKRASWSIPTLRWMCNSAPKRLPARKATGCRPGRARAGT